MMKYEISPIYWHFKKRHLNLTLGNRQIARNIRFSKIYTYEPIIFTSPCISLQMTRSFKDSIIEMHVTVQTVPKTLVVFEIEFWRQI